MDAFCEQDGKTFKAVVAAVDGARVGISYEGDSEGEFGVEWFEGGERGMWCTGAQQRRHTGITVRSVSSFT